MEVQGYGLLTEPGAADSQYACARRIVNGLVSKFFIKMNDKGEFFDPNNKSFIAESSQKSMGMPKWRLKEVKKATFEAYIDFISTGNKAFLNLAKRS